MTMAVLCIVGPQDLDADVGTLKRWNAGKGLSAAEKRNDAALRDAVRAFFEERLDKALKGVEVGDARALEEAIVRNRER